MAVYARLREVEGPTSGPSLYPDLTAQANASLNLPSPAVPIEPNRRQLQVALLARVAIVGIDPKSGSG